MGCGGRGSVRRATWLQGGLAKGPCAINHYQVHTRPRVQRASGVPHALFGRKIQQSLGRTARRGRERVSGFFVIATRWPAMTVITSKRRVTAVNDKTIRGMIRRRLAHQINRDAAEIRGLAEPPHWNRSE